MAQEPETIAALQAENARLRAENAALEEITNDLRQGVATLQQVIDVVPTIMFAKDVDGYYIWANRAIGSFLGYTPDMLIGKTDEDFFPPEAAARIRTDDQRVMEQREVVTIEEQIPKDDQVRTFATTKVPLIDNQGEVIGICGVASDITGQRTAETDLHQNRQFLSALIDTLPVGVFVKEEPAGRFAIWNRATEDICGYSSEAMLSKTDYDLFPQEQADFFRQKDREVFANGERIESYGEPLDTPHNGQRKLHTIKTPIYDDAGQPRYLLGVMIDITAQLDRETDLQLARFTLENAADAISWCDSNGKLLYFNKAASILYGYDEETGIALHVSDIDLDFTPDTMSNLVEDLKKYGSILVEREHRHRDGTMITVETTNSYIAFDDQEYICFILRDIRERKQQERELRIFKAAIANAVDGIGMADNQGCITYANAAYGALCGLGEAMVGRSLDTLYDVEMPQIIAIVQQVMEAGFWVGTLPLKHTSGKNIPVQVSVFPVSDDQGDLQGTVAIVRDITEQLQAEAEREALQQRVIDAQRNALRELSTPLIPISDTVLIMPLIGTIDSQRAQMVLEALLEGVAHHQASTVILDITGVQVVDTQVANSFLQAAQAVRLLGADVILTGIRPAIAQTLVSLGVDLSALTIYSTLQAGIDVVLTAR